MTAPIVSLTKYHRATYISDISSASASGVTSFSVNSDCLYLTWLESSTNY